MAFKFEKLLVWEVVLDLTAEVNNLVRKLPNEERFVLAQQLKRAADSVMSNITEGSTEQSNNEFKIFLGFSIRSSVEVASHLYIGEKEILFKIVGFQNPHNKCDEHIKKNPNT